MSGSNIVCAELESPGEKLVNFYECVLPVVADADDPRVKLDFAALRQCDGIARPKDTVLKDRVDRTHRVHFKAFVAE